MLTQAQIFDELCLREDHVTTRIHIVNFGPERVLVDYNGQGPGTVIHPQSHFDFYVYKGQVIHVTELRDGVTLEEPEPGKVTRSGGVHG